jgi:hypothetical protein
MKGKFGDVVGGWAFLLGVILAVVVGLFSVTNTNVLIALVVIGLVVGLLNVGAKESLQFLFSGLVLVLISSAGQNLMSGIPFINGILTALLAIFIPATVVVAVKNVMTLARK